MSRVDQDDGCAYCSVSESITATIEATVKVTVIIDGLSDRDLDNLDKAAVLDAVNEEYGLDADIIDYEVTDTEVSE